MYNRKNQNFIIIFHGREKNFYCYPKKAHSHLGQPFESVLYLGGVPQFNTQNIGLHVGEGEVIVILRGEDDLTVVLCGEDEVIVKICGDCDVNVLRCGEGDVTILMCGKGDVIAVLCCNVFTLFILEGVETVMDGPIVLL